MTADNLVYFTYLYNTKELIKYPKHTVTLTNTITGKTYVYGCIVLPDDKYFINKILPHLAWLDEEYNLTDNEYNPEKYEIIFT